VLRDGWKLTVRDEGPRGLDEKDRVELFNLDADPYERNNLAKAEAERVVDLRQRLVELRSGDLVELPADLQGIKD
jgi:hypothetical protein